ncbi:hypothetical protein Clacol_001196 [Clathrus columnatus]|uniref:Peptidase A1 domain-containing protein n=1 Tax=Clathrus columnatus TaxID=1419009 RepID=A0AAV5A197_9AGAM|nr:hypothetical protein Clacol_001196 [Clathrus columnatus]
MLRICSGFSKFTFLGATKVLLFYSKSTDEFRSGLRRHSQVQVVAMVLPFSWPYRPFFALARPTSRKDSRNVRTNTNQSHRIVSRDELSSSGGIHISLDLLGLAVGATIGVGTPPQNVSLLIDTGSSVTIIGGQGPKFIATNTTIVTGNVLNATFGTGETVGIEGESRNISIFRNFNLTKHLVLESVTLVPGFTIANQSIGVIAAISSDFPGIDGLIGLGMNTILSLPTTNKFSKAPKDSSHFEFATVDNRTAPTLVDTAFDQGLISEDLFGIGLSMNVALNTGNPEDFKAVGELNLGGISTDLFCGNMTFISTVTPPNPGANAWSVGPASLSIGNSSLSNDSTIIFDTGSSLLFLPDDQFKQYQDATGGVFNETDGLLHYTISQVMTFPPFVVEINGISFSIPALAQLSESELLGGGPGDFVALVGNFSPLKTNETLMGFPWFSQFYMAFDNTNKEVGIAKSINAVDGCPP